MFSKKHDNNNNNNVGHSDSLEVVLMKRLITLYSCDPSRENVPNGYPFELVLPFTCRSNKFASVRTACVIRSKKLNPFVRLVLSVCTACHPFKKKLHPFARLVYPFKKVTSVRTACVIRSKKLNPLARLVLSVCMACHPFKKNFHLHF